MQTHTPTIAPVETDPRTAAAIAKLIAGRFDSLIAAPEASRLLGVAFGGVRAWDDALADMRRGRTHFHGLCLLPYARMNDGRGMRPMYLLSDVQAFIEEAKPLEAAKPRPPIPTFLLRVDPLDVRHWTVRTVGVAVGR